MRVAETRAVNRALRKAYGIGLCSIEELGSFSASQKPVEATPQSNGRHGSNRSSNGQARLRDQLCLLIRQYNLDPTLVKAYAADFCGTATLKEASRDLVESFISELATAAKNDRDSLLCKLNSYAQSMEVKL
jgi:acyl CoA:acetate/3-ketoacid CoA transferase alpha subunit